MSFEDPTHLLAATAAGGASVPSPSPFTLFILGFFGLIAPYWRRTRQ